MSSLSTYKEKRSFATSPEPKGQKKKKAGKSLAFVIHKHAASHLHYDLRLELDGVLKSWAVPKGMPKDCTQKRLAIMTEDHPYDYKDFEGIIPKGNYGAGSVLIWDSGIYTVPDSSCVEDAQRQMRVGLKKGHIKFELKGTRFNASYSLIKTKQENAKNTWLLIKKDDEKTLIKEKKIDPYPKKIQPMLAKLVSEPFDKKNWLFEIKWDGYRAIAFIKSGHIKLMSRNEKSFNLKFPSIVAALKEHIKDDVILDGEVVVLDEKGRSNFQSMQRYQKMPAENLYYYVFDLLFYNGKDLRNEALIDRKEKLELLLEPLKKTVIRYSDHVIERGIEFFKQAKKHKLEGIIAKNATSIYEAKRSPNWLKIKTSLRQEVVIGGFTAPKGARAYIGALLLGVYSKKGLHYIGKVGTGFSDEILESLLAKLQPLIRKTNPFEETPKGVSNITFVKPTLVCEVSFTEWTKDGALRHPVYLGLRIDKEALSVVKENASST